MSFRRAVVINDGKILKQAFSSPTLAGRPKIKVLDDWSRRRGVSFIDYDSLLKHVIRNLRPTLSEYRHGLL